jgi:hypothetical protein
MQPFVEGTQLRVILNDLLSRGLITFTETGKSNYKLAKQGADVHAYAIGMQREIRLKSMEGISQNDYTTAVHVLQQIVSNLDG